jgi:hypothetical protein
MKLRNFVLFIMLLCSSACNVLAAAPTPTSVPSPTLEPTETAVPQPTATFTPTAILIPTDTPDKILSLVVLDGFTISIPVPLVYQVNKNTVLIGDENKLLNISFTSEKYDGSGLSAVIDSFLASLEKRGWQFTKGESKDIQIDGKTGLVVSLTGTAGDITFEGEAVAAVPRSDLVVFGLGISKTNSDANSWKNAGQTAFDELTQSIKFADANATCPVSTDKTLGYKEANPIKVGGGDFDGPSRERAYLDHLLDANGGQLSYERQGSMDSDGTILDIYQIKGSNLSAILYVDEYNFTEPQAPVGFTCNGAFPLSAP